MGHGDAGRGRCRERRADPGHHLVLHTGGPQGFGFFPTPPEHEWIAALEADDLAARATVVDEPGVDLGLAVRPARPLAHIDELGLGRRQVQQLTADEPVVDDHVGPTEQLGPAQGQQPRVPRPGPDQGDAHRTTFGRRPSASPSVPTDSHSPRS